MNKFSKKMLKQVRESLEDTSKGMSPIIKKQKEWYGSENFNCLLLRDYVILDSWFFFGLVSSASYPSKISSAPLAQLDRATAF